MSKNKLKKSIIYKNFKKVLVEKFGFEKYEDFMKLNNNLSYIEEYTIEYKEEKLKGLTKYIFENVYCGKKAQSYYKIYEFKLS